ncbi:MAG: DUF1344 domain-containing protein [Candidatus Rokubacteria bacterium]|nr:DUF1344 domain-containing protein [Candidatus Rokubacteria bacterium]MBI3105886.1 DUF1344 domain-containing protein [Candidatus Rokubacteria bacterium]
MRKLLSTALMLAIASLVILTAVAGAAEIQGKVQSVDPAAGLLTLEDGTKLTLASGMSHHDLKPGSTVKVSYEDKNGSKVVTNIQVMPGR